MKKRIISFVLVLIMLTCELPLRIFANDISSVSEETELPEPETGEGEGKLYYSMNGGSFVSGYSAVTEGEAGTVVELPGANKVVRPGYVFLGWFTSKTLLGEPVETIELGKSERYVYAAWRERYFTVTIPDIETPAGNGTINISAEMEGAFDGDNIDVRMNSEGNWRISDEKGSLKYSISSEEDGPALANGDEAAVFTASGERQLFYSVNGRPKSKSDYSDTITFEIEYKSVEYKVTIESEGGDIEGTYSIPAGTAIYDLPYPSKDGLLFVCWCSDAERKNPLGNGVIVTGDTVLYAKYREENEIVTETFSYYAHAFDMEPDFVIGINSSEPMTEKEVDALISFTNAGNKTHDGFYTITGDGTQFNVFGNGGFVRGTNYILKLNSSKLSFTDIAESETRPTELHFSIFKENVANVTANPNVKYLPASDVTAFTVNGKQTDVISVSAVVVGASGTERVNVSGDFSFSGDYKFKVGDIVCIYYGDIPTISEEEIYAENSSESYVKITDVSSAGLCSYIVADPEDVLFTPDVFPVPYSADEDGNKSNSSITASEKWFIFTDGSKSIANYDADTTVDVGDYLVFYDEASLSGNSYGGQVNYARINTVNTLNAGGNVYYVITYTPVTEEELTASMDLHYSRPLSEEELNNSINKELVEQKLVDNALESGFVDENVQNMTQALINTDDFQNVLGELGVDSKTLLIETTDDFAGTKYVTLDGVTYPVSGFLGDFSNSSIELLAAKKVRIAVAVKKITPYITTELKYFSGLKGLRLSLEIEIEVALVTPFAELKFLISGEFQQEVKIEIGIDAEAEWDTLGGVIPYISEFVIDVTTDVYEYTAFGIEFNVSVEATNIGYTNKRYKTLFKAFDFAKTMKDNVDLIKDSTARYFGKEEDEALAFDLAEKYSEIIAAAEDNDWADLVCIELFTLHRHLLGVIDIAVGFDGIISAKVNVSAGFNAYYAAAKRYIIGIRIFEMDITKEVVDLQPEVYDVTIYLMGTVGIRLGIQIRFQVGVISTKAASVGIYFRVGCYFETYGYFYYINHKEKFNGTENKYTKFAGALMYEFGPFLNISAVAQAGENTLHYSVELFDKQWPLVKSGRQDNVQSFVNTEEEIGTMMLKGLRTVGYLPENLYDLYYLDMKKGAKEIKEKGKDTEYVFFSKQYPIAEFTFDITNPAFEYNPDAKTVSVNPGAGNREENGQLIITFSQPLSFTKTPIQLVIDLHWDDLADGYFIGFESNGGSLIPFIEAPYGTKITRPDDPVRQGYIFTGWYSDPECTQPYVFPDKMPYTNPIIYAGWTEGESQFRVEHYKEGLDGIFVIEETELLSAKTNSEITPETKFYDGFSSPGYQSTVVTPDGSAVVTYYYTRNLYTAVFRSGDGDDASVIEVTVPYEGQISVPLFNMAGYDLVGWDIEIPEAMPSGDLVINASWTPRSDTLYTVRYYLQNAVGIGYTLADTLICRGTTDSFATAPEKEYVGYILADTIEEEKIMSDGSTVIRVFFNRKTFRITFESNGGSKCDPMTERFEALVNLPVSIRQDYGLTGWYTDKELTEKFDGIMPMKDITLYAHWEKGVAYTVKHYQMGLDGKYDKKPDKSVDKPTETEFLIVQESENLNKIVPSVKSYKGFKSPEAKTVSIDPSGKTVIEYLYERQKYSYSVDRDDGSDTENSMKYYDEAISLATPKKTGYTFVEWNVYYDNGEKTNIVPTTMPADNIRIVAVWKINSYTVTFQYDNGSADSKVEFVYNSGIKLPATPTKTGYDFVEWQYFEGSTQVSKFTNMPAKNNIVIKAVWKAHKYTITYENVSPYGTNTNKNYYYINSDNLIETLKSTNYYTFDGWSEKGSSTKSKTVNLSGKTGDRTYVANWTAKKITVTLNPNGEGASGFSPSVSVTYGSTASVIDKLPSRSDYGYTFNGYDYTTGSSCTTYFDKDGKMKAIAPNEWFDMAAENKGVTLFGSWTAESYTITYKKSLIMGGDYSQTYNVSDDTQMSYYSFTYGEGKLIGYTTVEGSNQAQYFIKNKFNPSKLFNSNFKYRKNVVFYPVFMYTHWQTNDLLTYYDTDGKSTYLPGQLEDKNHNAIKDLYVNDNGDYSELRLYFEGIDYKWKTTAQQTGEKDGPCEIISRKVGQGRIDNTLISGNGIKKAHVKIEYYTKYKDDGQQWCKVYVNDPNKAGSPKATKEQTSKYTGWSTIEFDVDVSADKPLKNIVISFTADGKEDDAYYVQQVKFEVTYS